MVWGDWYGKQKLKIPKLQKVETIRLKNMAKYKENKIRIFILNSGGLMVQKAEYFLAF